MWPTWSKLSKWFFMHLMATYLPFLMHCAFSTSLKVPSPFLATSRYSVDKQNSQLLVTNLQKASSRVPGLSLHCMHPTTADVLGLKLLTVHGCSASAEDEAEGAELCNQTCCDKLAIE